MARQTHIVPKTNVPVIVRMAAPEFERLRALVFRRYPDFEWASFARFGWRDTPEGLVLTLAALDEPGVGDLDEDVGHVAIQEPYTLRIALASETHPLAVAVIHSHPQGCRPRPSTIDDDMDSYYGRYFHDFAPDRPYISLIFSEIDGEFVVSGRVLWRGEWLHVVRFSIERTPTEAWVGGDRPQRNDLDLPRERTARLNAAFGEEAAARLRRSTVAVIGAGGTGSAAIEVLVRAGVGRIVIVDPDHVDESNLERIHGSRPEDAKKKIAKALLAREHALSIDPNCKVVACLGSLPQKEVVDAVVGCDMALGCTDQQHSRVALSDLATRYLVPSLDCGVLLEGRDGKITAQVLQIIRFLAADPCALCRGLVTPQRLAQELMSPEERDARRAAAKCASEQDANAYWRDMPQLNTVGYLTTTAGALSAGYAIGWLSGRFDPPFGRLQLNLTGTLLDVTDSEELPRPDCSCRRVRGWSDQAAADALITAPGHWSAAKILT